MAAFLDISMRVADPLDEYRLFEARRDRGPMEELYARVAPQAGDCALSAPIYYGLGAGIDDVRAINDFVQAQQASRQEIDAAFGVVELKYEAALGAELARLAENGFAGVVWSCRAQGVFADDAVVGTALRRAHELGLQSLFPTVPYSTNEALWRLMLLARRYPEIPMIVSGALQSWDNARMIVAHAGEPANLFYDTMGWSRSTGLAELLDVLGPERLLFGSGGAKPCDQAARRLEAALNAAGLGADRVGQVMRGNALQLIAAGGRR